MRHRLALGAWLTVIWIGLWGDLSWANLAGGIAAAGVVMLVFDSPEPLGLRIRPVPLARFVAYFFWSLLRASFQVAIIVVTPRPVLSHAVLGVPIAPATRGVTLVIAAAISLTPGTLVIETSHQPNRTILYIHVLNLRDRAETVSAVARLEQLATAAFAPSRTSPRTELPGEVP